MVLRHLRRALAALTMAVCLLSACGGGEAEPQILTVGVLAPFSGEHEPLGRSVRNSVLLAAEGWNQAGGVLGFEVQVALEDTACDYQTARRAADAAIDAGSTFLIGAVCANASEGVAQIASQAGALQITPGSVNLDLTLDIDGGLRPLVFRVPSTDDAQATVAARFAYERLGHETAGILYAEDSAYGTDLARAFTSAFEALGGQILEVETYDQDGVLFFEALEPIREAAPDLLYVPGYYNVMNLLVPQARQFGLLMPVMGSDGWHAPGLDREATSGAYLTTHYVAEEPASAVRSWVSDYEARYLVPPDALATMTFDAANVLFQAIEEAGSTDPSLVSQAMAALEYEGVSGLTAFDEAHNPIRSLIVMRVDPAGFIYQGRFQP